MLESFLNIVAGLWAFSFIKKRFQRSCFSVKFAKFLRTPTLANICEWLLLYLHVILFTMHEKDLHEKISWQFVIRNLLNIYDEFFFSKTVNNLLFPQKSYIIDIWHGSKCRRSRPKVFCKESGPTNFKNSQERTCNSVS